MAGVTKLSSLFPTPLQAANNLSDLASVPAALAALGLGATPAAELARIGAAGLTDWRQGLIELAKTRTWLGQIGAFADGFFDQSNVDVSNSVNAVYSSTGLYYSNPPGSETSQSLPAMTGASAPSNYAATASSYYDNSSLPYYAFDQSSSTNWGAANPASTSTPQWVQRVNPTAFTMSGYFVTARSDVSGSYPTAWTLYGTNDNGNTLTVLDTQTGQTFATGGTNTYTIPVANRGSFTGHRISITAASQSNGTCIAELGLLKQTTSPALDLRSAALALPSVPTKGSIFVIVNPLNGATITPQTNLIASISQNGTAGTITWTQVVLTLSGTSTKGYLIYEANGVTLPGTGQALKTRVQTTAGTGVQVLGVYAKVQ